MGLVLSGTAFPGAELSGVNFNGSTLRGWVLKTPVWHPRALRVIAPALASCPSGFLEWLCIDDHLFGDAVNYSTWILEELNLMWGQRALTNTSNCRIPTSVTLRMRPSLPLQEKGLMLRG